MDVAITTVKRGPGDEASTNKGDKGMHYHASDNSSYVGSEITTDSSYDDEIRTRFLVANRAYFRLQNCFVRNVSPKLLL